MENSLGKAVGAQPAGVADGAVCPRIEVQLDTPLVVVTQIQMQSQLVGSSAWTDGQPGHRGVSDDCELGQ